jgi:CheY-like chemotaxis protein
MSMGIKERLLTIWKLKSTKIIEDMDEETLNAYVEKLKYFVDAFPDKESSLKDSLKVMDHETIVTVIDEVVNMLANINVSVSSEAKNYFSKLSTMSDEQVRMFANKFVSDISILSIDIQMALYKESGAEMVAAKPEGENDEAKDEAKGEAKGEQNVTQAEQREDRMVTILAVDDASFYLNNLNSLLKETRYKLVCVNSGEKALAMLSKIDPSLFILDINMPEMNGFELATRLRTSGYDAPIIFLTGNAKKENVLKGIKAGGSDFVAKPISQEQLIERIEKFVR